MVFAWRVAGQALQKVTLQLGPREPRSGDYPVLAGLAVGDRVLRNPGSNLVDGQRVEFAAVPAAAAPASAAPAAPAAPASK